MRLLAEGQIVNELPFPPAAFGLLALGTFGLLLAITFAFRSVGTRHGAQPQRPPAGRPPAGRPSGGRPSGGRPAGGR